MELSTTANVIERLKKSYLNSIKLGLENGNKEKFEDPAKRQQFKDQFAKLCEVEQNFINENELIRNFECDSVDDFDKEYAKALKNIKKENGTIDMTTNQKLIDFSNELDNVAVGNLIHPADSTAAVFDDGDIQMEEAEQTDILDPFSKTPIVDPVRNTVCNHIYDRKAVMDAIQANNRTKCAYVGCGNKNPIRIQHLIGDENLKAKLLRKHAQDEDDFDDED